MAVEMLLAHIAWFRRRGERSFLRVHHVIPCDTRVARSSIPETRFSMKPGYTHRRKIILRIDQNESFFPRHAASPTVILSGQIGRVRVLPIIFRMERPKNVGLYPGELVDVYIGQ